MECFDIVINSVFRSLREDGKVFNIKANQRKKIRLINENEHLTEKYEPL